MVPHSITLPACAAIAGSIPLKRGYADAHAHVERAAGEHAIHTFAQRLGSAPIGAWMRDRLVDLFFSQRFGKTRRIHERRIFGRPCRIFFLIYIYHFTH